MKIEALRACDVCHQPVSGKTRDGNAIDFHRLVVERHLLDFASLKQHAGLSLMLGSAQLASAMGPSNRGSFVINAHEVLVCNPCFDERFTVLSMRDEPLGKELVSVEEVSRREARS